MKRKEKYLFPLHMKIFGNMLPYCSSCFSDNIKDESCQQSELLAKLHDDTNAQQQRQHKTETKLGNCYVIPLPS